MPRWLFVLLLSTLPVAHAGAEGKLDEDEDPAKNALANTRWAMILPERDYEGGCIQGFLAWRFSPTGYFIYNNKVQGSWRVDALGTVRLRTRAGVRFFLTMEDNQLKASQNLPFMKRGNVFQKCPNE